jgi:hypothetical protein
LIGKNDILWGFFKIQFVKIMKKWTINWADVALETFSVFLGITLAFFASEWSDNRKNRETEKKLLLEIHKALANDIKDMEDNAQGHELGIKACRYMKRFLRSDTVSRDSMNIYSFIIIRTFLNISNTSVYDNLKAEGLDLIRNDSLRNKLINLYGFQYEILEKVEEHYAPTQFHTSYHDQFAAVISRSIILNDSLKVTSFKPYKPKSSEERSLLFMSLNEIEGHRGMLVQQYKETVVVARDVQSLIEEELGKLK